MEIEASEGVTIPSTPQDRKKLQNMIIEATHCLQKIDDQNSAMRDIFNVIKDEYTIPTKLSRKLAKTMFKQTYANVQQENEDFNVLYEMIVEGRGMSHNPNMDPAEAALKKLEELNEEE